ncbi:MAG: M36 family metallopeptidase, partial [Nocardioidaceae bacterium]
ANVDVRDKQAAAPRTTPGLLVLPGRAGAPARLVWRVLTTSGSGVTASYVDAADGHTLRTVQLAKSARPDGSRSHARGTTTSLPQGQVFDPNPVVSQQDEGLTDDNDANRAVPAAAYQTVDLRNLRGNHTLVGKWAQIINNNAATPTPDSGTGSDTYFFKRSSDYFEQVNAYYAVNAEQEYLRALGLKQVNAESQQVKTDAFADDNSYYDPSVDRISLGSGGVDDAEDPEVIWHEYGHAIQDDQIPGFGTTQQSGAIGEGFGDYMAAVMSQAAATPNDTPITPAACLMDWDSTSYTPAPHCIRRTDLNLDFRTNRNGEVHHDGQIWSRALWDMYLSPDINTTPGDDVATRIIVEAQFNFTPSISMPAAAKRIINTAKELPGTTPALVAAVKTAFEDRHIL